MGAARYFRVHYRASNNPRKDYAKFYNEMANAKVIKYGISDSY